MVIEVFSIMARNDGASGFFVGSAAVLLRKTSVVLFAVAVGVRAAGAGMPLREQASASRRDVVQRRVVPTQADVSRLRKAAEQGDANAENDLGLLYASGRGVSQDLLQAFKWFQMAAGHGLDRGQFNLGEAYAKGSGVLSDDVQAFQWYVKAATQGLPEAQFAVGNAYAIGTGVLSDDLFAFQWFLKSAQQRFALAQLAVGEAYILGKGVTQSDERAFPWLRQAADQGLPRAEYLYGMRHPRGPLSDDIAVAAEWFRKAAEQDYAPAQFALGALYQRSSNDDNALLSDATKIVVKDSVEADRWFKICWKRASGELAARCGGSAEEIERHMSPDDVFEAETRAVEWMQAYSSRQQ
jgi:TPR repeat protein